MTPLPCDGPSGKVIGYLNNHDWYLACGGSGLLKTRAVEGTNITTARTTSPSVYLGVGLGVGGVILIAIVFFSILTAKRRAELKRAIDVLEVQQAIRAAQEREGRDVQPPVETTQYLYSAPLHAETSWRLITSDEHTENQEARAKTVRRMTLPTVLSKRFKQHAISLRPLKRWSSLSESRKNRHPGSYSSANGQESLPAQRTFDYKVPAIVKHPDTLRRLEGYDVFVSPGNPKLDVFSSFAIPSPDKHKAECASDGNSKAWKSKSLDAVLSGNPAFAHTRSSHLPVVHLRSFSFSSTPACDNVIRCSIEKYLGNQGTAVGMVPFGDTKHNRVSAQYICSIDRINTNCGPGHGSLNDNQNTHTVTPPRSPQRRSSTPLSDSLVEYQRIALLGLSDDTNIPSRSESRATRKSSYSSNDNPFQCDQPSEDLSALTENPPASEEHESESDARTSASEAEVIEQPAPRLTVSNIVRGIRAESPEPDEPDDQSDTAFVSNRPLSTRSSARLFAGTPREQTQRGSLSAGSLRSPIWKACTEYQDREPVCHVLNSILSASPLERLASWHIGPSASHFSTPSFFSSEQAAVPLMHNTSTVPAFSSSQTVTSDGSSGNSSPIRLRAASEVAIPSSPTRPVSWENECDTTRPEWRKSSPLDPSGEKGYDREGPAQDPSESEGSSTFIPFTAAIINGSTSRQDRKSDSPPVSPKTKQGDCQATLHSQDISPNLPRTEGRSPLGSQRTGSFNIPNLLHSQEEFGSYGDLEPLKTYRSCPESAHSHPIPPPRQSPSLPNDTSFVSPLNAGGKTGARDTHTPPPQILFQKALGISHMAGKKNEVSSGAHRHDARLSREAQPLLPWISSPDPQKSRDDTSAVFDVDTSLPGVYGGSRGGGEYYETRSAVDDTHRDD